MNALRLKREAALRIDEPAGLVVEVTCPLEIDQIAPGRLQSLLLLLLAPGTSCVSTESP